MMVLMTRMMVTKVAIWWRGGGDEGQVQGLGLLCNVQPLLVCNPLIDNLPTSISILPLWAYKETACNPIDSSEHYRALHCKSYFAIFKNYAFSRQVMSLLISKLLFVDISDRCEQQLMEYRYLTMNRVTVVEEIVFESIGHNITNQR